MPFKSFEQLLEPDPRFKFMSAGDPTDLWRPMGLKDHYECISELSLSPNAPEHVRSMFDRARHAFVFAWFDYELTVLAEQYAFGTLEAALRAYYATDRMGLRKLLRRAIDDGLLPATLNGGPSLDFAVSAWRNHWAHGADGFGSPTMTITAMELCADLINRVFAR